MSNTPDFNRIRHDIIGLIRRVGTYVLDGLDRSKQIETKSSSFDAVTEYDRGAEAMLVAHLKGTYPQFGLIGEEGSRYKPDADYVWYIDPIDGTNNFAHGIPFFAVSVGLWQQGEREKRPVVGVLFDPARDELFHAVAGDGAFVQCRGHERKLKVSTVDQLEMALTGTGFPYDRATNKVNNLAEFSAFHPRVQGLRRLGVAALDIAYVAAGRFDIFWEYDLKSWDIAAAILFLLEAGGTLTTLEGEPFQMAENVRLLATNGHLHEKALAILTSAR